MIVWRWWETELHEGWRDPRAALPVEDRNVRVRNTASVEAAGGSSGDDTAERGATSLFFALPENSSGLIRAAARFLRSCRELVTWKWDVMVLGLICEHSGQIQLLKNTLYEGMKCIFVLLGVFNLFSKLPSTLNWRFDSLWLVRSNDKKATAASWETHSYVQ